MHVQAMGCGSLSMCKAEMSFYETALRSFGLRFSKLGTLLICIGVHCGPGW